MNWLNRIHHQDPAIAALHEARQRGRLPHAYLFWGPEGVGKTRTAQGFAQLMLCVHPDAAPCGECSGCSRVARFIHPDFHMVLPWKRGNETEIQAALKVYGDDPTECLDSGAGASISIDRVRGIKMESAKARVEGGCRIIVIRDAERLTAEAAQAALKLIEEPQAGTYLVLTCGDPAHLLPTIVSRCQRLRFRPLPREAIEADLRGWKMDNDRARLIAGLARGSLGFALRLREVDVVRRRQEALDLFAPAASAEEVARRVQAIDRVWNGDTARTVLDLVISWQRDLLAVSFGFGEEEIVHGDRLAELREVAARTPVSEIRRQVDIFEELGQAIDDNVNPALALQVALLRMNGLIAEDPLFKDRRGE